MDAGLLDSNFFVVQHKNEKPLNVSGFSFIIINCYIWNISIAVECELLGLFVKNLLTKMPASQPKPYSERLVIAVQDFFSIGKQYSRNEEYDMNGDL